MIINKFNKIDKKILFIIYFIIFNIISVITVSVFHVYQRFLDLNNSILNGVNRAVDNGIKLSDLRGSLRDIADSYLDGKIMSSSYLFSNINKVEIIKHNHLKCSVNNNFLVIIISKYKYISIDENFKLYICFINDFYSDTIKGKSKIATWVTGYPVKLSSISGYLVHIIILSLIIMFVSILVLYKILLKQEEYKKRQLTIDIIKKLKHEINRPISKIQNISKIIFNSLEEYSQKNIKDKINQIFLLTKTHNLVLNSMFSYSIEKNGLKNVLEENEINILDTLDYCINISLKGNIKNLILNKNISKFYEKNMIIMDKVFLEISISNILTNAYEAVFRNYCSLKYELNTLKLEIKFDFDEDLNKVIIEVKNYGSYLHENYYEEIFKPGITSNKSTNTGYGLPILKDIVDAYNGNIFLTSYIDKIEIDNSWVCFRIEFNNIKFKPKPTYNNIFISNNIINYNKNRENKIEKSIVVLIDDEIYLLDQWKQLNPGIEFIYFSHYDNFFDSIDLKKLNLNDILLVLTDYYFDKIKLGMTLLSSNSLSTLREIYDYEGFIVLVSNVSTLQDIKYIDATFNKIPININNMMMRLMKTR